MTRLDTRSMVADAQSRVEGLSPTDVSAALDGETLLVDVREPEERRDRGMLSGSVPVPRGLIEFIADPNSEQHSPEFDMSRRLILYCDDGTRSALAADTLFRMGYWRVAYLDGGLDAWEREGRHVEQLQASADGVGL